MSVYGPHESRGSWTLDVFPRSIMYIRLSEYWVFWDISLHGIILHCISSIIHSWWLYVSFGVWKILNVDFLYWWNLNSKCNIYIYIYIYIYILVQSKNLFSYITPVTTSSLSVNETYWVHVVSYSYYTCCTLCGADSIPSRSTSRGANWVRAWSSWSCGEMLGCSVVHSSVYLLFILLLVFRQVISLC